MWHPPQPVAFSLLEACRHRDRGRKARKLILAQLRARDKPNEISPENSRRAINCVRDLQLAVLLSFTAIESLANHMIDMLDDDEVIRRKDGRDFHKSDAVRWLSVDDKLKLVPPLMAGGVNIAGTAAWEGYKRLKWLRDELVHVKRRGNSSDPDEHTAYDRL